MRAALVCGSPKRGRSTSGKLLDVLQLRLDDCAGDFGVEVEISRLSFADKVIPEDELALLARMDAWVFSLPLYVDGIPGHVLSCMEQICARRDEFCGMRVFAIENCGFFEGIQTELALEVLRNWCDRCGFAWSGGVGAGGAPALGMFEARAFGRGPSRRINDALHQLASAVVAGGCIENSYPGVSIPRFAYKVAAELGWRTKVRANGGRPKDLGRRL